MTNVCQWPLFGSVITVYGSCPILCCAVQDDLPVQPLDQMCCHYERWSCCRQLCFINNDFCRGKFGVAGARKTASDGKVGLLKSKARRKQNDKEVTFNFKKNKFKDKKSQRENLKNKANDIAMSSLNKAKMNEKAKEKAEQEKKKKQEINKKAIEKEKEKKEAMAKKAAAKEKENKEKEEKEKKKNDASKNLTEKEKNKKEKHEKNKKKNDDFTNDTEKDKNKNEQKPGGEKRNKVHQKGDVPRKTSSTDNRPKAHKKTSKNDIDSEYERDKARKHKNEKDGDKNRKKKDGKYAKEDSDDEDYSKKKDRHDDDKEYDRKRKNKKSKDEDEDEDDEDKGTRKHRKKASDGDDDDEREKRKHKKSSDDDYDRKERKNRRHSYDDDDDDESGGKRGEEHKKFGDDDDYERKKKDKKEGDGHYGLRKRRSKNNEDMLIEKSVYREKDTKNATEHKQKHGGKDYNYDRRDVTNEKAKYNDKKKEKHKQLNKKDGAYKGRDSSLEDDKNEETSRGRKVGKKDRKDGDKGGKVGGKGGGRKDSYRESDDDVGKDKKIKNESKSRQQERKEDSNLEKDRNVLEKNNELKENHEKRNKMNKSTSYVEENDEQERKKKGKDGKHLDKDEKSKDKDGKHGDDDGYEEKDGVRKKMYNDDRDGKSGKSREKDVNDRSRNSLEDPKKNKKLKIKREGKKGGSGLEQNLKVVGKDSKYDEDGARKNKNKDTVKKKKFRKHTGKDGFHTKNYDDYSDSDVNDEEDRYYYGKSSASDSLFSSISIDEEDEEWFKNKGEENTKRLADEKLKLELKKEADNEEIIVDKRFDNEMIKKIKQEKNLVTRKLIQTFFDKDDFKITSHEKKMNEQRKVTLDETQTEKKQKNGFVDEKGKRSDDVVQKGYMFKYHDRNVEIPNKKQISGMKNQYMRLQPSEVRIFHTYTQQKTPIAIGDQNKKSSSSNEKSFSVNNNIKNFSMTKHQPLGLILNQEYCYKYPDPFSIFEYNPHQTRELQFNKQTKKVDEKFKFCTPNLTRSRKMFPFQAKVVD